MEFSNIIFQAWKGIEFACGSWKVMEMTKNDYSENIKQSEITD